MLWLCFMQVTVVSCVGAALVFIAIILYFRCALLSDASTAVTVASWEVSMRQFLICSR